MASITQTIPNYTGGISEQPDQLKVPGQVKSVQNAIPDIVNGLYKRPGAKRIGTTPLANFQSGGSIFHYYRDETEGSYIGQVASDGKVRMWSCNDGAEKNVWYATDNTAYSGSTAAHTSITSYLTPSTVDGVSQTEDIQALTINDTTFLNNRSKVVGTTGTTTARPHKNFAFVELLRTENGRQYALNISDDDSTDALKVVTRLKIDSDELGEGHGSGQCLGIGTEVYHLYANTYTIGGSSYTSTTLPSGYAEVAGEVREYYPRLKITLVNSIVYNDDNYGSSDDEWLHHTNRASAHNTGDAYRGQATRWLLSDGSTNLNSEAISTSQSPNSWTSAAPIVTALQNASGYSSLPFTITYDGLKIFFNSKTSSAVSGTWTLKRSNSAGGLRPDQTNSSLYVTSTSVTSSELVSPNYVVIPADTTKQNLTFRLSVLGQQGVAPTLSTGQDVKQEDYGCAYNRELTLLHGGEGYSVGDTITVSGPGKKGKLSAGSGTESSPGQYNNQANFTVKVTEIEEAPIKANIRAVRPAPTPFDADTSISQDAILGGIASEISAANKINGNDLKYKLFGNGIYLYTENDADDFNVEIVDKDLMRVMQSTINDVTSLPFQCVDGLIVQISNTRQSAEDDYYVKFHGENGNDGPGSWKECAAPGIVKSFQASTLPHVLQRQSDGDFLVKEYVWEDREVGDNVTNPIPSFVGKTVNRVLFFRNRLAFLSGEHVITSRTGSIASPNFWSNTALIVSANDPIDISCSSNYPSELYDAIEITAGLLCFSSNAQFLLASDDTIMNPDTAKLRAVSWYNYDTVTPPVSLGQTVGFIDNSNKYSRFMEMANVGRENEPAVVNTSQVVPTLLAPNSDLFTNSRENGLVLFGKTSSDTVIGFRYLNIADKRQQAAWFKWKFKNSLKYQFIINDQYFFLDSNNFLQSVNLVEADNDLNITQDSTNYLIHLDNYTTVANGVYNATTNITTFTNQSDWIDQITNGDEELVVVDTNSNTARLGRYAECTVINSDDFTVPGDWSSATLNIGYLYEYNVEFPRFYLQKSGEGTVQSDINSKLTVHRMKLNFGKIGLYATTLTRVGKTPYTDTYESTDMDEYDASDAPYLAEKIKDIPIYERNTNVDVTLKSSHPAPATLRSMSWEGDWSPMHYRRV